jgi:hypothetical protein
MKKYIIASVVIFAAAVAIAIINRPTEKKRVIGDLKRFADAVEWENRAATISYIDPMYRDSTGLVYPDLISLLIGLYADADSIHVNLSGFKVYIDSIHDRQVWARCSLGVRVWANFGPDKALVFGGVVQPSPVLAYLKKSELTYRVYSAEY